MRIITLNLNGIRSAHAKGAFTWLAEQNADVICLQEVRAFEHQLPELGLPGYEAHWNLAERAGYSGVGVLSRITPNTVSRGIRSKTFDPEGRVLRLDFDAFSVASVYIPSGSSGEDRQAFKMEFLKSFLKHAKTVRKDREVVFCGDFNIAHQAVDLKNWRSNQTNSGFLPEEREWVDQLIQVGFRDAFRDRVGPDAVHYSWWSNRGRARENNVGWRLDYQFATPGLAGQVREASIYTDSFFSDHAPVVMDYEV